MADEELTVDDAEEASLLDLEDEIDPEYNMAENFALLDNENEEQLKNTLYSLKECTKIVLSVEIQAEMKMKIGTNISAEKPWKQIRKEVLEDFLPAETRSEKKLQKKLHKMDPGELVLIGFAPALSEEEDTFYIFENEKVARIASDIIKKLESFDRKKALAIHYKYPRPWKSLGSEVEVEKNFPKPRTNIVDVEVQSIYPIRHNEKVFRVRMSDDVRDGYVELVPQSKKKIDTINRLRLDIEIQSAPEKVLKEQQTDPTFPTNIWSQYAFDVIEEDSPQAAEMTEEEIEAAMQATDAARTAAEAEKPESERIPISNRIHTLLETLEFNEIDMYKNDYPIIAEHVIERYEAPSVDESLCFTDINKCRDRVIVSMDWHPEYSGIIAAAYAFDGICTFADDDPKYDPVKRATFEQNPVILWSFNDVLKPKLEMSSPREVNCISFCPYDGNLLVGGCMNGQVIIWDLKGRIKDVESLEILTYDQQRYRNEMNEFLKWTKQEDYKRMIEPAAVSSTQLSHRSTVTCIKWLGRHRFLARTGIVTDNTDRMYEHFVTSSLDGTIMFWDTHWVPNLEQMKKLRGIKKLPLPQELQKSDSVYKPIDKLFHPHFKLALGKPITYFLMDSYPTIYEPLPPLKPQNADITLRIIHEVKPSKNPDPFKQSLIVSTLMAEILATKWEGYDFDQGGIINSENITGTTFANIHDSVILSIDRNPFVPEIFLSIAGDIIAIWHSKYLHSPILWRRTATRITDAKWSLNRPSVFFISRADGALEMWDLMYRIDKACKVEILGGRMITCISQHRLTLPQQVLAVGDFDSNLRILIIPAVFVNKIENELEKVTNYFTHELERKLKQEQWIADWFIQNKELLDFRKRIADEARAEMERIAKEQKELDDIRQRKQEIENAKRLAKEAKEKKTNLSEILERKWQELNMKRMQENLKQRVSCKRKIIEEKVVVITEEEKLKAEQENAVKSIIVKGDEDYSVICERLTPAEKHVTTREDMADAIVEDLLNDLPEFEPAADEFVEYTDNYRFLDIGTFQDVLLKGRDRRLSINKELGGNVELLKKVEKLHYEKRLTISDYRNRNQFGSTGYSGMGGGDYEEGVKEEEGEEEEE